MKLAETLLVAALSDRGMVRPCNEDAIFVDAAAGLAILADGMGGYKGGEVASDMAITLLSANLGALIPECFLSSGNGTPAETAHHLLEVQIAVANYAIYNTSRNDARYTGMGTTLVVAWFYEDKLSVAHVGDSRLYRLRGRHLEQMTRDHSVLQEQIDSGMIRPDEARYFPQRNLLTRALGVEPMVLPSISQFVVEPEDVILICSDGLYEMVDEEGMAMTLRAFGDDLPGAASHLVAMANEAGGRDNISVILVKAKGEGGERHGWWPQLLAVHR